jgi:Kdo2-lipid IVA lauroyltransferase/acyltransferase
MSESEQPIALRRTKPLENWLTRQTLQTLWWAIGRAPDRVVSPAGTALGSLCFATMRRYRRVARANLKRAFGATRSPAEIERMAQRSFHHLGRTLIEFLRIPYWDGAEIERRVELRGTDHLEAALAQGRGVIGVTAHYGNWELLGARIVRAGYPVHVIVRDADDPATNALLNRIRRVSGCRVISRSDGLRPSLACLRRNEILTILLDQNTMQGETFVEFFGHPAATATGPAVLARRTGAVLIPAFDRRLPDGRHVAELLPPVAWDDLGGDVYPIREITARLTRVIEQQIRVEPEQWLWLHDRWKRQPEKDGSSSLRNASA